MRQNLMETYSRQLSIAEAYVAKNYDGKQVSANTKLTTAVLLDNTNRWITESMNTVATGRSDLGDWKKFCLNLTNLAVPSLIANDLVIVHPMTSYSGSVAYLKYVSKTNKGGVAQGDEFNGVFGLGAMNDARVNFTAQAVVEEFAQAAAEQYIEVMPVWNPVKDLKQVKIGDVVYEAEAVEDAESHAAPAAGKVYYNVSPDKKTIGMKFPAAVSGTLKVGYRYDQEYTPAEDIPTIGPKMEHIALVAEPRRIAVRYDQITAFQAKTDYGFSLDKQIAEQACGELAYEIDTEIVDMLREGAGDAQAALTWSKTLPVGVSKFEHYNGFLEIFEAAKTIIYNRTGKFHPNYMVVAADVMQVLRFVNGFQAAKAAKMNGPYKVGEIDGIGVYVSPRLAAGEFFFGLNGNDMMSAAGVYAPYMAIVPTQLLGTPDGGLAQGFSTWYAKALLNENLLVAGKIVD